MTPAFQGYYARLYGLAGDEPCRFVDPSGLTFYWHFVPDRSSFAVTWIQSYCPQLERGLLWGPIDDAYMSTRLVRTYDGAEECREDDGGWDDPCLAALAAGFNGLQSDQINFPGAFAQKFDYGSLAEAPEASHWRQGIPDGHWCV